MVKPFTLNFRVFTVKLVGVQNLGTLTHMSLVLRKPVFGVSDQVRHKPGCATTEDG